MERWTTHGYWTPFGRRGNRRSHTRSRTPFKARSECDWSVERKDAPKSDIASRVTVAESIPSDYVNREVDIISLTTEDIPFVSGKECKTLAKLSRVSGAELRVVEYSCSIEIHGTARARHLAQKFVKFIVQQRTGTVLLTEEDTSQ